MSDVVDVLVAEHDRIRRLAAEVQHAAPADRRRLFTRFERLVTVHETGDRTVVHPAVRRGSRAADTVALACMAEEGAIERALADLQAIGVEDAAFADRFAELHRLIDEHLAHEERDEFPLLRIYVPVQRLHMLVGQLHDIEVMAAR